MMMAFLTSKRRIPWLIALFGTALLAGAASLALR